MLNSSVEVVIIGGGAAGVAAGRRLAEKGVRAVILEARSRLGGRAWTRRMTSGAPLDLGCGWLHSADRNPWTRIARETGFTIDETPPPWARADSQMGMSSADRRAFGEALGDFRERIDGFAGDQPDQAASRFLEPSNIWNPLIDAVSTYYSGAELDRVSARDLQRYEDSGVNWRVPDGYGALVASWAANLDVEFDCEVMRVDHRGATVRIETAKGVVEARTTIITLPSAIIARSEELFEPRLPWKTEAALDLPLGLADKLFIELSDAEAFEAESRAFGKPDQVATAGFHFRPFGRPMIEAYFGGDLACELETAGAAAFFDFAADELVGLFGADFRRKISPLASHGWRTDRWAMGSYSYARPGKADSRGVLAASVDDRLFFAGEACSRDHYSTAHGAYLTGVEAADQVVSALRDRGR